MLALFQTDKTWEDISNHRPAMLIDGAHHARELTSMSMCVYTVMQLLFSYAQGDNDSIVLLKNSAIFVIPVVNYDGYYAISE
jgi:murein tripeptide amidase MpaA